MRAAIGLILVLIPSVYLGPRIGVILDIVGALDVAPGQIIPALWSLLAMRKMGVPVGIPATISFVAGLMLFASAFHAHQPAPTRTRRRS